MGIGNPIHLMFLGAVALVVLGPKRLPELARALGKGMQEFRDSMSAAVNGEDQGAAPLVPHQPQLAASSESQTAVQASVLDPSEAVVHAPEQSSSPPQP
jgi:sec-independent protein translocase protein TatA